MQEMNARGNINGEEGQGEEEELDEAVVGDRRAIVDARKGNKHAKGTKTSYLGKQLNFALFAQESYPGVLASPFRDALNAEDEDGEAEKPRSWFEAYFDKVSKEDNATHIFKEGAVTGTIVEEWLAGFNGRDGVAPSKSVLGGATSALNSLLSVHGFSLSKVDLDGIKDYKKGTQRERAESRQNGTLPAVEGKAALNGETYALLMRTLVINGETFSALFCVLAWNLMVRISNVSLLRASCMLFSNDALQIHIVKHKADQEGVRTDPKHCYANPTNFTLCTVSLLAMYFAQYGAPRNATDEIFPGDRQHDRFVESIRDTIASTDALRQMLERQGITIFAVAAHSLRKGARSFASAGTTAGPSTPTLLMRGNWKQEGMDAKYVRYENAGDQQTGRILSMLSPMTPSFGALPPHFDEVDDVVLRAVRESFGESPPQFNGILVMCLASLVYHRNSMRSLLAKNHPIFRTPPFTLGIVDQLGHRVALEFAGDTMTPTGVPPSTTIMVEVQQLKQTIASLPSLLRDTVHDEFEQRAFDAGQISRDNLSSMLVGMEERLLARLQPSQAPPAPAPALQVAQERDDGFERYLWGGAFHPVPEDFAVDTRLTADRLFRLYHLGDHEARVGPYKKIKAADVKDRQAKARVSDMHVLMGAMQSSLEKSGHWFHAPTTAEVEEMWRYGKDVIEPESKTQKGKKRRLKQMAWTTALNNYRRKLARVGVDGDDDDDDE
jgi:hypothetical protein